MPDLIVRDRVPHTHPDELTEETLPIVHDCPQVAVTIRAEEMTEFELTYACLALKKTEDRYHATLRTDQDNPVKTWYDKVEILVFGSFESMNAYHLAVRGYDIGRPTYFWPIDEEHHPWILMTFGPSSYRRLGYWGDPTESLVFTLFKHEYVHHLDATFHERASCLHLEGVAEYFADRVDHLRIVDDGSDLLPLSKLWDPVGLWEAGMSSDDAYYRWGYVVVRFLFEEHPLVMLDLYDLAIDDQWFCDKVDDYVNATFPALDADFGRWLEEFRSFKTIRQVEPIILFLSFDEDGDPLHHRDDLKSFWADELYDNAHSCHFPLSWRYFQSSRPENLTVSVSLSENEIVDAHAYYSELDLYPVGIGTVEVTLTVTAPDGKSESQTFTVTVLHDLQSKEIVIRDPLSIEEGYLSLDLSTYFAGPALEDVEFVAASSNPNVAPVSLDDGRLVITAGSPGETEVTLRGNYQGRVEEQTFTIVVTDECPLWLCRGTFTGWRAALLGTTDADTQTTQGR